MEENIKNRGIQRWGIASLISVLMIELLSDNIFVINACNDFLFNDFASILKIGLSIFCLTSLLLSVAKNWKYIKIPAKKTNHTSNIKWHKKITDILKTLIKNSVSGNALDLLFVVFFLLHLTWIPDSIFDYVKESDITLLHPFIFVAGILLAIMVKPQIEKETKNNPLVLLTGISNIDQRTVDTIINPLLKEKTKDEYNPENFEHIIVFIDKSIKIISLDGLSEKGVKVDTLSVFVDFDKVDWSEKKNMIEQLLKELIIYAVDNEKIQIELIDCSYNKIQPVFDIISNRVNELLFGKYNDIHLMFNLTPGNKNISTALALNSIQGNRRTCYIQQNSPYNIEAEELDVFKIKDIFSELAD